MPRLNLQSSRDIRQRNEQFSGKARAGKNPINASRKEKLAKQSPIPLWALGLILFVVIGGGTPTTTCSLSVCTAAHSPWSSQFSSRLLDSSSFERHDIYNLHLLASCLRHEPRAHASRLPSLPVTPTIL